MSGACCNEMDIWEANSLATAVTPHTCARPGSFACTGAECTSDSTVGVCDKSGKDSYEAHVQIRPDGCCLGCGNNPFAFGARDFYGPGMTVDTSKPFTVVTQFITSDNTPNGTLSDIRRMYIQNGRLIENAAVTNVSGQNVQLPGTVTQDFCTARNASSFLRFGGVPGMGQSLSRGMVLIFSLWNSDGDFMNCTIVLKMFTMDYH